MDEDLKKIPKPDSGDFRVRSIDNVNHKPHPYCITPNHLKYNDSMYIGGEQIERMERTRGGMCGMYTDGNKIKNGSFVGGTRCTTLYSEHTSDKVLFVQSLTDEKNPNKWKGFTDWMKATKPIMEKLKIDGLAFIAPSKGGKS